MSDSVASSDIPTDHDVVKPLDKSLSSDECTELVTSTPSSRRNSCNESMEVKIDQSSKNDNETPESADKIDIEPSTTQDDATQSDNDGETDVPSSDDTSDLPPSSPADSEEGTTATSPINTITTLSESGKDDIPFATPTSSIPLHNTPASIIPTQPLVQSNTSTSADIHHNSSVPMQTEMIQPPSYLSNNSNSNSSLQYPNTYEEEPSNQAPVTTAFPAPHFQETCMLQPQHQPFISMENNTMHHHVGPITRAHTAAHFTSRTPSQNISITNQRSQLIKVIGNMTNQGVQMKQM